MAVIFNELTKQDGLQLLPGVSLAFEDADAEPYFVALGWAKPTDKAPIHTYSLGEVNIDPEARQNSTGLLVADLITKGA